jgi:hypothetical protein
VVAGERHTLGIKVRDAEGKVITVTRVIVSVDFLAD